MHCNPARGKGGNVASYVVHRHFDEQAATMALKIGRRARGHSRCALQQVTKEAARRIS
jgi:hypothetical protein